MSDAVLIVLIPAIGAIILQAMGLAIIFIMRKDVAETKRNMDLLEKNTNSMKDALVKITGEQGYDHGFKAGKDAS